MDLVEINPSKELEIKIEFDGQKVSVKQTYEGKQMGQSLEIHIHVDVLLDAIAAKVNNNIFTGIITVAKQFMKLLAAEKVA